MNHTTQVQRMNERQLDMPCLGRPFRLGMLYDYRSDQIIPGITLWDSDVLAKAHNEEPQPGSNFEVIAEDTIEAKSSHLGLKASLKLSLMGGLVNVSGAASYLNDRTSSKRMARVTLQYKTTSRFEQLGMDQLGQIQHPRVLEDGIATHVVTGVIYGAEAYLVFDRYVAKEESFRDIHGKMKGLVSALPGLTSVGGDAHIDFQGADKNETDKFQCKFYGDFILPENPSTFQDAVKVYQQLPKLLGGKDAPKAVPMKVWLYPLSKLDTKAQQIVREISVGLVNDVQKLLEDLHHLEIESNDIGKSIVHKHFKGLREQMSKFRSEISGHKLRLVKRISALLPKIRGGGAEEAQLAEVLRENNASPFSPHQLSTWLRNKEKEEKLLASYLGRLEKGHYEFCFSDGDLDTLQLDFDKLVCFAFTVGGEDDSYLEVLSTYQRTGKEPVAAAKCKPWYEDGRVKQSMRVQLKKFEDFAKVNEARADVKFAVTDINDTENTAKPGAVIMLYSDDVSQEFEPPGKPGKPCASESKIHHDQVTVEWTKPSEGTDSIKRYIVLYRSAKDPGDKWVSDVTESTETSTTVKGLVPETIYSFKVSAECEAGLSQESDISDPIITKAVKVTRAADYIKKTHSKLISAPGDKPQVYQLCTTKLMTDHQRMIAKCSIGVPKPSIRPSERVLMVVGATGAGKSTLINGIANYVLGVEWKDDFRFKLITDEGKQTQAVSQTAWITAYTFHFMNGSRLSYSLTVIDTPGFGDTRGIDIGISTLLLRSSTSLALVEQTELIKSMVLALLPKLL